MPPYYINLCSKSDSSTYLPNVIYEFSLAQSLFEKKNIPKLILVYFLKSNITKFLFRNDSTLNMLTNTIRRRKIIESANIKSALNKYLVFMRIVHDDQFRHKIAYQRVSTQSQYMGSHDCVNFTDKSLDKTVEPTSLEKKIYLD